MNHVAHVHDLGAKAMGNGQSRLPWQGQAREPSLFRRTGWLSANIRYCIYIYDMIIHIYYIHVSVLFISRGVHHVRDDSNPSWPSM